MLEITKTIEWDMAHRVPNHNSKCKNLHGHRYRLEVSVQGEIISTSGASDEGMVVDFHDLKVLLKKHIADALDHVCMYYEHDELLRNFFEENKDKLTAMKVPFIPTAENTLLWCYERLKSHLPSHLTITQCKLYETPNSWAQLRP